MSTKSSIRYEHADESGKGFHLYEEMFEEDNVYVEGVSDAAASQYL